MCQCLTTDLRDRVGSFARLLANECLRILFMKMSALRTPKVLKAMCRLVLAVSRNIIIIVVLYDVCSGGNSPPQEAYKWVEFASAAVQLLLVAAVESRQAL